jgi:hypothetical protein
MTRLHGATVSTGNTFIHQLLYIITLRYALISHSTEYVGRQLDTYSSAALYSSLCGDSLVRRISRVPLYSSLCGDSLVRGMSSVALYSSLCGDSLTE